MRKRSLLAATFFFPFSVNNFYVRWMDHDTMKFCYKTGSSGTALPLLHFGRGPRVFMPCPPSFYPFSLLHDDVSRGKWHELPVYCRVIVQSSSKLQGVRVHPRPSLPTASGSSRTATLMAAETH
jgi:hypothetical protein